MRLRTFIGIVAGILLSVPVHAQKNSVKVYDKERQQTVTATAITPDIVRIDIVPDGVKANTLPTLLSDDALKASEPQTTIKNVDNITLMNTQSGVRVAIDNDLKSISVSKGNTLYVTDLCEREGAKMRLDIC